MLGIDKLKKLFGHQVEAVVSAPMDRVFDHVAAKWLEDAEKTSAGPTSVGSIFNWSSSTSTGRALHLLKVTEYSPHKRLVGEESFNGGCWRHSFDFEPIASGTLINYRYEWVRFGVMLGLLSPIVIPVLLLTYPVIQPLDRWRRRRRLQRIESLLALR